MMRQATAHGRHHYKRCEATSQCDPCSSRDVCKWHNLLNTWALTITKMIGMVMSTLGLPSTNAWPRHADGVTVRWTWVQTMGHATPALQRWREVRSIKTSPFYSGPFFRATRLTRQQPSSPWQTGIYGLYYTNENDNENTRSQVHDH